MLKLKLHGFFWELRYYTCLIIMGPEVICLFGFWRNFPAVGGFQSRLRCCGGSKEESFLLVPEKDLNSYWIPNVVVCLNFNLGNRFWFINTDLFQFIEEQRKIFITCSAGTRVLQIVWELLIIKSLSLLQMLTLH